MIEYPHTHDSSVDWWALGVLTYDSWDAEDVHKTLDSSEKAMATTPTVGDVLTWFFGSEKERKQMKDVFF